MKRTRIIVIILIIILSVGIMVFNACGNHETVTVKIILNDK